MGETWWVGGWAARHLGGTLTQDLHERLLRAGLLEVGALLLLDHAHRVDERGREDRRGSRRGEAWLAARVAGDDAIAKQDAKLRDALEQHADKAGPQAGERGRHRRLQEDRVRLGRRDLGVYCLAVEALGKLLHQLAVGRDGVVADRLNGRTAEVGGHVLRRRDAVFPHLVVVRGEEERHRHASVGPSRAESPCESALNWVFAIYSPR